MATEHILSLHYGSRRLEVALERVELRDALAFVYGAFLAEGEVPTPPPDLRGTAEEGPWRGIIEGELFEFPEFIRALIAVEDTIGARLMEGVKDFVSFHASVVQSEDCCYYFLGKSGTGKTSASLQLVKEGLRYVTDEFAIVTEGFLHPFPRAAVRKYDGPLPEGAFMDVPNPHFRRGYALPHSRTDIEALPLGKRRVVFFERVANAMVEVRRLSTGEACARTLPSVFFFDSEDAALWPGVARFLDGAECFDLVITDVQVDLDAAIVALDDV